MKESCFFIELLHFISMGSSWFFLSFFISFKVEGIISLQTTTNEPFLALLMA